VYFAGGATRVKILVLQPSPNDPRTTFRVVAVRELRELPQQPGDAGNAAAWHVREVALDPPLLAPQGKHPNRENGGER
jgi:hypothetical protein